MNQKTITVIEPKQVFLSPDQVPILEPNKRVCAYARVSTDSEDQINSFNVQKTEYEKKIRENDNWDFVGLYADEGISGTSIKKRVQFSKMIEDAKAGKIDLILTKSLSRFARNTVDTLTVVRELRNINVEVFFEKENISSLDTKVDFLLTIFSSIAQEESRNISENVKWGVRKQFKEGKVKINTNRFLGYDKDEDGKIIINQEQAKTVEMIFNMYISGMSANAIATFLTENNIKNGRNEVYWRPSSIYNIITNEKYCGDAILQKRVIVDYLTHKSVQNNGHAPKYYIKNNHEPIIDRKTFELVQEIKKRRSKKRTNSNYGSKYALSGMVYCSHCGKVMNRHYYNYGKDNQRVVLSCKNRYKDASSCDNKATDNQSLELAIIDSIKKMKLDNPNLADDVIRIVEKNLDSSDIKKEITKLEKQISSIENDLREIININVESMKENTDFYRELYNQKKELLQDTQNRLDDKKSQIAKNFHNEERIAKIKAYLESYTSLSKNVLKSIFKAVISITQNEVIFVMNESEMSKKDINKNMNQIISSSSIVEGQIVGKKTYNNISYKVVRLGD